MPGSEKKANGHLLLVVIIVSMLMGISGVAWAQVVPVFVAAGTQQSGTGNVTVPWPAHETGDIALLFIESTGGEVANLGTANGFVPVTNSPVFTGAGTAGTRLTVYWARATSNAMASPIVTDPGDHVYARILTYRRVIGTGDPWGTDPVGGVKATASTSVTVTGLTTSVDNALVIQAVARDNDNAAAAFSAQNNANLTGITERSDAGTNSNNGGGIGIWEGLNATADAIGNSTATVTSSINAFLSIELRPATTWYSRNDGTWTGNNRWSLAGCGGSSAGNLEPGAGDHVVICNGDVITLDTSTFGAGLASLTINAGGELQMASSNASRTLTVAGNVSNAGTLIIPTNRTATSILNVDGNITNTGTFDFRTDANSLVNTNFTGGGSHTIDGDGAMRFNDVDVDNNLTINKTAAVITQTGTFDVAGDLQITSGTINMDNAVTVTGSSSISGTLGITNTTGAKLFSGNVTVNIGGTWDHTVNSPVTLNGNLTNNGTFTANTGAAAIYTFSGGSAQTITGTASATTTIPRLTLNNANGLSLTGTHNVEVSTLLTLTSGRISTASSNYLYISNGSTITGASASAFVTGNLRKRYTTTGNQSLIFEVGTITGGVRYAPVSVTLGDVTGVGDFTVTPTAGLHPDINSSSLDPALSINRYWTLTRNSVNFNANAGNSVQFTFIDPDDYIGAADFNEFIVGRYNTPDWTELTPTVRTNTTTTLGGTGITTATIDGAYQIAERQSSVATVFTAVSGGSAISADTNSTSGSGTYTSLTGLDIRETNNGGMQAGNYTLTAPAGFQFDTATNVTLTVNSLGGAGTNLTLSSTSVTPTTSTITFTVATISSGTRLNSLTFSTIRIRPTADCPMAISGNIVFTSLTTTTITDNNAGTLTEVAGTAADMYSVLPGQTSYSSTSCGTVSGIPTNQFVESVFNLSQLVVTDQFGNIQADYDNAGVSINYVYSAGGSPSFTSPVDFTDGVSTTTLTTVLDTAGSNVTITSSTAGLTGITSMPFTVIDTISCGVGETLQSGLLGEYFNNMTLSGPATGTRVDAPVDFNWPADPGVAGIGNDVFSVQWDGLLRATTSGNYQFETVSDDGVRLYVDNVLVINNWTDHAPTTDTSGSVALTAGQEVMIRLEFYENGGGAEIRLRWGPAGGPYTAIPAGPLPVQGDGLYYCEPPPPPSDIVVTLAGTADNINAGSILLTGTLNGDPEATNTNTNTGLDAITTSITTLTDYAWLVDIVGSGNTGSFIPAGGQTERWDTAASSSAGAMSTEEITTAGGDAMTQTHTGSNRNAHAVISLAPGPTSLIEFDSAFSANINNAASVDWDHVVPVDYNGKLLVGIAVEDTACSGDQIVTSVAHEGVPLEFITSETVVSGGFCMRVEIWYLDFGNPAEPYVCPAGLESGITGEYFNVIAPPASPLPALVPDGTRLDGPINFNWGAGPPGVAGINDEDFAVRWNGVLRVTETGNYRFQTNSDDGVRLWLSDTLIINNWTDHGPTLDTSVDIPLKAGQTYPIRLEYFENGGGAVISLAWERPSDGGFSMIPAGPFPVLGEGLYQCATIFLDHYRISHSGTGVSCLSEEITISAIDNSGDPIDPGNVTLDLSVVPVSPGPPPAKGNWVRVSAGSGTLGNQVNNGTADYQFPGNGESSVSLVFNYTFLETGNNSETINFDVTDNNNITDTRDSNVLTDPDLVVSLAGFQFYNEDTSSQIIPTQIAGKPSNVLPGNDVIKLRAVRASDDDPTQCVAAFPDASVVTIPMGAECLSPSSCAGRQMSFTNNSNTTPVSTNADNSANGTTAYTDVALLFEDSAGISRAELVLNYPDAGEMQLHARYEIPLDEGADPPAGAGSGGYMEGSSTAFVVRPFGFGISGIEDNAANPNPGADTPAGDLFVSAGTDFRAEITAFVWGSGDDDGSQCDLTHEPGCSANDGVPDTNADLLNNNGGFPNSVTPNFQGPVAANVTLTAVAPFEPNAGVGGVLGVFEDSNTSSPPVVTSAAFTAGNSSPLTTLRYLEVGSITLQAETSNYLGTGTTIRGRSSNLPGLNPNDGVVGRFGADQFTFTANTPEFGPACGSFTYIGQPFDYVTAPQITARATAADGTTILSNYEDFTGSGGDNWWLLDYAAAPSTTDPGVYMEYTDLASPTDIGLDTGLMDYTPNSGSNGVNGQQQFELSGPFAYTRNPPPLSPHVPFDGELKLDFSVRDSDGATGIHTIDPIIFTSPELRWGRLTVINASGSELLDISVPLATEYWDGIAFVVNAQDSCTVIEDLATGIILTNPDTGGGAPQPGTTTMVINDGTTQIINGPAVPITSGRASLVFSAADDGDGIADTGYVDIETNLNIVGSDDPWLRFDWADVDGLGDGPYDGNPSGRASFGIYKGPQDFIYIREPWN